MCVMKMVLMSSRVSSYLSQPQCSAIWMWDPSPQSSSILLAPSSTRMLDTFRYLEGFMDPVPRKTILGSITFTIYLMCASSSSSSSSKTGASSSSTFFSFFMSYTDRKPSDFLGQSTISVHFLQALTFLSGKSTSMAWVCPTKFLMKSQCFSSRLGMHWGKNLLRLDTSCTCALRLSRDPNSSPEFLYCLLQTWCSTWGGKRERMNLNSGLGMMAASSTMCMTLQMKLSALVRQALKSWFFAISSIDSMELQCRITTEGAALSGYFTYYKRTSRPLMVILPFLTSSEMAAPFTPKALRRSLSILPGILLGCTMQLVMLSPREWMKKGVTLISSFWKACSWGSRKAEASLWWAGGSWLMQDSMLANTSAKSYRLLRSRMVWKLLMPLLLLPCQVQQEMGTTLKPILYLSSSMQRKSCWSRQRRELQLSPLSQRVRRSPERPVRVWVWVLVKKQWAMVGSLILFSRVKRWKLEGTLKTYLLLSVVMRMVGTSCIRQLYTSCTTIRIPNNIIHHKQYSFTKDHNHSRTHYPYPSFLIQYRLSPACLSELDG